MPRPRKPTALRELDGDPNKSRYNHDEPQYATCYLDVPDGIELSEQAQRMWDRLVPALGTAGVTTMPDAYGMVMVCEAWARFIDEPSTVKSREVRAWLGEYGLTPAARSKIVAAKADSSDPMERMLAGNE